MQQVARLGHLAQALVDCGEDLVLDPLGSLRLLVDLGLGRSSQGALHLVDGARHDHPEGEGDQPDQNHVVDEQSEPSWDAGPREPLDPRSQRRGEDEGEKNEGQNELQLPEGERRHDDGDDDQRREGDPLRRFLHDQGSFAVRRKRQTR
jgi:hypothetical protein